MIRAHARRVHRAGRVTYATPANYQEGHRDHREKRREALDEGQRNEECLAMLRQKNQKREREHGQKMHRGETPKERGPHEGRWDAQEFQPGLHG